LVDVSGILFQ
jgi:hypothetical protein